MVKDEASQSDGASIIEKSVGLVERAWDAQWSLRLLFVVLFFDGAMLLRTGRGCGNGPRPARDYSMMSAGSPASSLHFVWLLPS